MAVRTLTLLLVAAFAVQAAPVPKSAKSTADRVTGRWQLAMSGGKPPSSKHICTFTVDGKMIMDVGDGDPVRYVGTWKITDNAIDYTMNYGNVHKAEKLDIRSLTDDLIRTTDPEGIEEEFRRVKD